MEARDKGLTEPDPREDLSGNDVARKLLILAREIGMNCELSDVEVENLIPGSLQNIGSWSDFEKKMDAVDEYYAQQLGSLPEGKVLRYIGELKKDGPLKVSLVATDKGSPLGNLSGSDSLFEIYTEAYGENPIIIQGAGAGAAVTARGVYSDLLRVGSRL